LEAPVLQSPLSSAQRLAALDAGGMIYTARRAPRSLTVAFLKFLGNFLGLISFAAIIIALCLIAEPGPQTSSFGATHVPFAAPPGDQIAALIREGR
jgi:hypothetical protein